MLKVLHRTVFVDVMFIRFSLSLRKQLRLFLETDDGVLAEVWGLILLLFMLFVGCCLFVTKEMTIFLIVVM